MRCLTQVFVGKPEGLNYVGSTNAKDPEDVLEFIKTAIRVLSHANPEKIVIEINRPSEWGV